MIARELHCTPREARRRVTSKDVTDYRIFFDLFPWSYDAAFLGCLISNLVRGKNDAAQKVSDFMPADQIGVDEIDEVAVTWENLRAFSERQQAAQSDG